MRNEKARKPIQTAMLAAICCVLTMVIQIPSPMNGYVNLGDCGVLLAGWILGPLYGAVAAGIGSMLADVFSGYAHYAPGTLLIKGTMALMAAVLFRLLHRGKRTRGLNARIASALAAEAVMIGGYFLYAGLLLGSGWGAAASIPGNVVQGIFGLFTAVIAAEALERTHRFAL